MKSSSASSSHVASKMRQRSSPKTSGSSSSSSSNRLGGMLCGAVACGALGYLVGFFTGNQATSPADTYHRLLAKTTGNWSSSSSSSSSSRPSYATGPSLVGCTIQTLFADELVPGMHLACVQHT